MTDETQAKFLHTLEAMGNVTAAAKAAGVHRNTAYLWRADHPEFAERWDQAIDVATDALEAEAWRRGVEGVERAVYHKGQPCGTVRDYSDMILIVLLKACRPEKYRENARVEHSGLNLADMVGEAEQRAEARLIERGGEDPQ